MIGQLQKLRLPTKTLALLPTKTLALLPTKTLALLPTKILALLPTKTLAPLPTKTLALLPTKTLALLPTKILALLPTKILAPLPTTILAPLPTKTLAPLPTKTLAPLPTKTLAPLVIVILSLSACENPSQFASFDAKTEASVNPPSQLYDTEAHIKERADKKTANSSTYARRSKLASKRTITNSELGQWRIQQAAVFADQDPKRRPRRLPKPFHAVAWNNFLPLLPKGTNATLTSDFGWRNKYGTIDFHPAIDIATSPGTPVFSPVTGTVLRVKRTNAGKSGVVILSGQRQYTFWHIDAKPGLRRGVIVLAKEPIGTVSHWGQRSHLHFSVHLTGRSTDPDQRNDSTAIDPISTTWRAIHNDIDLFAPSVTNGRGILTLDSAVAEYLGF